MTPPPLRRRFWNLDWTVQFDLENLELFRFTVDLGWRTVPCKKSMGPCEPWLDLPILWTMIDSAGSHSFCVSSLKRHRWTLFSVFFFSYMASFGLMGIRIPHIETLKPSNLNHSFISHLCLSLTTHSHLSSLPLSLIAISHHSLLTQSLSASLSLCRVAIGHHELPRL